MVATHFDDESATRRFLIRPNCSLSWDEAKRFYLGIVIVSMSIGLMFAAHGAWLILPFAGLEMLVLGGALYCVARRAHRWQVVLISRDTVEVCNLGNSAAAGVTLQRAWARVELRRPEHAWYPNRLTIGSHGRFVEIGRCLNDTERSLLADELSSALRSAG